MNVTLIIPSGNLSLSNVALTTTSSPACALIGVNPASIFTQLPTVMPSAIFAGASLLPHQLSFAVTVAGSE